MNLLIIGYCHLDDGFLYAGEALKKLGYKIYFFPYLTCVMDKIVNRDEILMQDIRNNDINICLWWCNNVTYESYDKIIRKSNINKNILHYFYNWDFVLYNYEKYNAIDYWKERVENKKLIYPLLNHIFVCYEREIEYFKNKIQMTYASPGFDKNISYYEYDKDYECDISIVCTNLYRNTNEFPNEATNITRYEIVDKLYENRDKLNFHIYGYENLKEIYPDCYKGFIKYQNCYKVFSNSKINLSIHPIVYELNNENSEQEYFSERLPQILGCKGLLMTNSLLQHKLNKDEDYIYIDNNIDWFNKIIEIINSSSDYDNIRENGYKKSILYYQWDEFAKKINEVTKSLI
jgi:hypothetical protein